MNDERPLEDELLELIRHRFRRSLINIIDLANLELTANSTEQSDLVASLTRINAEAMQTLNIADALLSLAQWDKTPVPCEPFDLAQLVRQLTSKLQRQAADAGATVTINVPVSLLEVMGSVEHWQKMLSLLLEFALWQGQPNILRLQIVLDSSAVQLSLQFDTIPNTLNAIMREPMPLTNLLSLWAHVRAIRACGRDVYCTPRTDTKWKLTVALLPITR